VNHCNQLIPVAFSFWSDILTFEPPSMRIIILSTTDFIFSAWRSFPQRRSPTPRRLPPSAALPYPSPPLPCWFDRFPATVPGRRAISPTSSVTFFAMWRLLDNSSLPVRTGIRLLIFAVESAIRASVFLPLRLTASPGSALHQHHCKLALSLRSGRFYAAFKATICLKSDFINCFNDFDVSSLAWTLALTAPALHSFFGDQTVAWFGVISHQQLACWAFSALCLSWKHLLGDEEVSSTAAACAVAPLQDLDGDETSDEADVISSNFHSESR